MTALNPQRLEQTLSAIAALDLGPIKFKATRHEDGYGWTAEQAERMELAYKRYLMLHAKYPGLTLAPDQDVDRFWHLHILDTRKYAADCEAVFGYFLHHFPYLGLRGEDDAKVLESAFATTQALYAKEFGESSVKGAAWCGADAHASAQAAWCGADSDHKQEAAWCGTDSKLTTRPAWCGADGRAQSEAAWCGADVTQTTRPAWCGAEVAQATRPAWCGAEVTQVSRPAWCGADVAPDSKPAWCGTDAGPQDTDRQPSAAQQPG